MGGTEVEHLPPDSPDALVFDAAELGEPRLAVIAENRAVQAALLSRCVALGVRVVRGRVTRLHFDGHGAQLEAGGESLTAQLVAGADGANSAVRAAAGIDAGIVPGAGSEAEAASSPKERILVWISVAVVSVVVFGGLYMGIRLLE